MRISGTPPAPDRAAAGPVDTPPALTLQAPAATPSPAAAGGTTDAAAAAVPPAAAPADPLADVRRLHRAAVEAYAAIPAYGARLRQRETVRGKDGPEEVIACKFRKQPWSVYFKWVGKEANGREVAYVQGQFEDKIHSRLAAGDVLLMPAGARFSIAPTSPLARGRSRHPITEAGIGPLIDRFGHLLDPQPSALTYRGRQTRSEFPTPVEAVEQVVPAGAEEGLPQGGRRLWCFAADSHLPVLISTRDEHGHEVEYYCYEQVTYPANFSDDDFNPDRLWGKH